MDVTLGDNRLNENVVNHYNALNQLTDTLTKDSKVSFTYDAEGLRTSKTVNGEETLYIWDNDQLVLELTKSGKVKKRYIRGNDLIYADEGEGTDKTYYAMNPHGDVVQLIDGQGNVTKTYEYDSFGNELEEDSKDDNPFRYCGEYYDKETREVYLRARYYQPEVGRFLTRDTYTGQEDDPLSLHLYAYCGYDGVNGVDPSGHFKVTKEHFKRLKWNKEAYKDIDSINKKFKRYGITNKYSIALFIATCSHESGNGKYTTEQDNGKSDYYDNKKYDKGDRGAGYLQITSVSTHRRFLRFVMHEKSYIACADLNTADYIGKYYPWESACWGWGINTYGENVNLNKYVAQHYSSSKSINLFLVTQYFINGYKDGIDTDLRQVREGKKKFKYHKSTNEIEIYTPDKSYDEFYEAPTNWEDRVKNIRMLRKSLD